MAYYPYIAKCGCDKLPAQWKKMCRRGQCIIILLAEEDVRVICDSGGGRGHLKECVLRKCRGRRRYRSNGKGCHANGTAISSRRKEKGFSFGAVMSYILPEAAEKPPIDIWSGAAQLEKRVALINCSTPAPRGGPQEEGFKSLPRPFFHFSFFLSFKRLPCV